MRVTAEVKNCQDLIYNLRNILLIYLETEQDMEKKYHYFISFNKNRFSPFWICIDLGPFFIFSFIVKYDDFCQNMKNIFL